MNFERIEQTFSVNLIIFWLNTKMKL